MNISTDTFRTILWFALCILMAIGMLVFALFYGVMSILSRNFAWKKTYLPSKSIKFPKAKLAIS